MPLSPLHTLFRHARSRVARGPVPGSAAPRASTRWAWRQVLGQAGVLLLMFTAFRVAFFLRYRGEFDADGLGSVLGAFAAGLRFDVAAIATLGGIPWLVLVALGGVPWRVWVARAAGTVVVLAGGWAFVLFAVDLFYYSHVGRRLSFEAVELWGDWRPIAVMIGKGYGLPTALELAVLALGLGAASWAVARAAARPAHPAGWWRHGLHGVAALLLVVLVGRGGLAPKPLHVGAAFGDTRYTLGHLTLNPVFTVLRVIGDRGRGLYPLHFVPAAEGLAVTRDLIGRDRPAPDSRFPLVERRVSRNGERRRNVVVIVLESFSSDLTGVLGGRRGITPSFDRLAAEGRLYANFYAVGTRSIEGIATLLTGFPALPGATLLAGALEQHRLRGLPEVLKEKGYASFFLHGAFRGSMGFDRMAARLGFDRYIAQEDFAEAEAHSDGVWGIYDEFAFDRLQAELERAQKPVFAFFFSLTSHTPFTLPAGAPRPFGPGEPEADKLNSFAYTDRALGRFFARARQSAYYRDTTFVVTADHHFGGNELPLLQRHWIPLLIVSPGDPALAAGRDATLGGQADVPATLLDLLDLSTTDAFVGRSLLRPAAPRRVLLALGSNSAWLSESGLLIHDLTRPVAFYRYRSDPALEENLLSAQAPRPPAVAEFEGYVQTLNNLLLANRVFPN